MKIEKLVNRLFFPHKTFPYRFFYVSHRHKLIYLAIPKNANSFLRSIFLQNHEATDFSPERESAVEHLRHNGTRHVRLQDIRLLKDPRYSKFTVLRAPENRLVSGFLDKLAKPFSEHSDVKVDSGIRRLVSDTVPGRNVEELTFHQFVLALSESPESRLNHHFLPQSRFLNGLEFDHYGDVANIDQTLHYLYEHGFDTWTSRIKSPKRTGYAETDGECFADTPIAKLNTMTKYPKAEAFFNRRTQQIFRAIYADDVSLYQRLFGDFSTDDPTRSLRSCPKSR